MKKQHRWRIVLIYPKGSAVRYVNAEGKAEAERLAIANFKDELDFPAKVSMAWKIGR